MKLSKNISYNGAEIIVNRETMRSRLQKNIVYRKLGILDKTVGEEEWEYINAFAHLITQCTITGTLEVPVPLVTDGEVDVQRAFEAFLDSDGALYNVMVMAINEVDAPLGDPDLTPNAKKKAISE
jgi:hypothetical protein